MRTTFRVAALLVGLAIVVFWLFGGPNTGWTKNRVPYEEKDDVTGQTVTRYQERFIPGVDFLAGGLAATAVLVGCSFIFGRDNQPKPN